jgi:hypothetical protein
MNLSGGDVLPHDVMAEQGMSPHLLVAVSGHGYGHFAQVAPVLNALHGVLPDLRLTLRTPLAREHLAARLVMPFEWQAAEDDFGMVQHDALEVDAAASMARYRTLHRDWESHVQRVTGELVAVRPDLVLADVPYLTLAAASRAGIPALAMCCLNWLDIFRHYCGDEPLAGTILAQMREAYASAALFLRTEPAMPMPELGNVRDIGVVAASACNRRSMLEEAGLVAPGERLLLVAMGGIAHRLPVERWPQQAGLRYLLPGAWNIRREDAIAIEETGFTFSELLASSDAVLTKPGYGTFTEAAVNGIPVLYVARRDWPEQPWLIAWLAQHGRCREVSAAELLRGEFGDALLELTRAGSSPAVLADGVRMAVDAIRGMLPIGPKEHTSLP